LSVNPLTAHRTGRSRRQTRAQPILPDYQYSRPTSGLPSALTNSQNNELRGRHVDLDSTNQPYPQPKLRLQTPHNQSIRGSLHPVQLSTSSQSTRLYTEPPSTSPYTASHASGGHHPARKAQVYPVPTAPTYESRDVRYPGPLNRSPYPLSGGKIYPTTPLWAAEQEPDIPSHPAISKALYQPSPSGRSSLRDQANPGSSRRSLGGRGEAAEIVQAIASTPGAVGTGVRRASTLISGGSTRSHLRPIAQRTASSSPYTFLEATSVSHAPDIRTASLPCSIAR
jgi:hypothetical protein